MGYPRTYDGTNHIQVNTGLGFECDESILELVLLLNKFPGITTQWSCQGTDRKPAYVMFIGKQNALLKFCRRLRPRLDFNVHEYGVKRGQHDDLRIKFQPDYITDDPHPWTNTGGVRGSLEFAPNQMGRIVRIVGELLTSYV